MLLAIDVGNTHVKIGVFDGETLRTTARIQTVRDQSADDFAGVVEDFLARENLDRSDISGVVLGSVVPPLTLSIGAAIQQRLQIQALVADPATNCGMAIHYDPPTAVGADRIVNAIAAYERFGRGNNRPVIVCDCGTATKFEAVTAKGEYLGGAICPGLQSGADSLFERTARLPHIEVRRPLAAIGRTTISAMQSGVYFGHVGLVEGLVGRIKRELGYDAVCVATGGLSAIIAAGTQVFDHTDMNLTLDGLRLVWERNAR